MNLSIRPVELRDKERWLELWKGYLIFYKTEFSADKTEVTWNRLLDPNFNLYCLVAEDDGQIKGITTFNFQNSTWSENGQCLLEDLFVDETIRGQGTGRALIDAVISEAKKRGCSRVYWNTDETNQTARKLYDSYVLESGKRQYRIPII
jgi:GNAT superfamily N-acetyltransferase